MRKRRTYQEFKAQNIAKAIEYWNQGQPWNMAKHPYFDWGGFRRDPRFKELQRGGFTDDDTGMIAWNYFYY